MPKRRNRRQRSRELEIAAALVAVHADPNVRDRDRRLFRAAKRRLSQRSDEFLTSQNVRG